MRARKKKNAGKRLEAQSAYLIDCKNTPYASGRDIFKKEGELYLEIGCGKGKFICESAKKEPDKLFIGVERVADIVVTASERRAAIGVENVRFLITDAVLLTEIFKPGTIDGIFLNFSDPWPKKGHAKRRLTHPDFLRLFRSLLKENGELRIKTDNRSLFDFSLSSLAKEEWYVMKVAYDLHNSPLAEGNVKTEYETRFSEMGAPIYFIAAR